MKKSTLLGCAISITLCSITQVHATVNNQLNKGIFDTLSANTNVVANEQFGIEISSQTSITFFVNTSDWADVHYILNSDNQHNARMIINGSRNTRTLTGLSNGDIIKYSYTYLDESGAAKDSPWSIMSVS